MNDHEWTSLDRVWITRYALTKGIYVAENVMVKDTTIQITGDRKVYFHRPYWHTSEQRAIDHAIELIRDEHAALHATSHKLIRQLVVYKQGTHIVTAWDKRELAAPLPTPT